MKKPHGVRLRSETIESLKSIAKQTDIPKSALIREAVESFIEQAFASGRIEFPITDGEGTTESKRVLDKNPEPVVLEPEIEKKLLIVQTHIPFELSSIMRVAVERYVDEARRNNKIAFRIPPL